MSCSISASCIERPIIDSADLPPLATLHALASFITLERVLTSESDRSCAISAIDKPI